MGKDGSQFGFRDKSKADETIRLLAVHDPQYQKLTVRGLLGRAQRVLKMTKAEDKINNIKAAIKVFEDWLEQNSEKKTSEKTVASDQNRNERKIEGLGFKDKAAATNTLKVLEGRDPNYQRLAVKGLIGNAKRVLLATKNEEKIKSIKDGIKILDDFLEDFDRENRAAMNMAYLPINVMTFINHAFEKPKDKLAIEFFDAYNRKANGQYELLRTLYPTDESTKSWDIVRNTKLETIKGKIHCLKTKLFNDDNSPTEEHLEMIYWAYSPNADKLKAYAETHKIEPSSQKRKSDNARYESMQKKQRT